MDFAVFNIADCAVTCGAVVLIGYLIVDAFSDKKSQRRNPMAENYSFVCELNGTRIDKFLTENIENITRSAVQKSLMKTM